MYIQTIINKMISAMNKMNKILLSIIRIKIKCKVQKVTKTINRVCNYNAKKKMKARS